MLSGSIFDVVELAKAFLRSTIRRPIRETLTYGESDEADLIKFRDIIKILRLTCLL